MDRKGINYLGLLGMVGFISYVAAVVFSPMAYPGYNWMSQAVSDLSAADAPSAELWNKLSLLSGVCSVVISTLVAVYVEDKLTKIIRIGIYLYAIMNWISYVGYGLFPLSTKGYGGTFQDIIHTYVVTVSVVLLSIISLLFIIIGGIKDRRYVSLAKWALFSLLFMAAGAIGVGIIPARYFGIPERFSVLSATFFNGVLGIYLFKGFIFR